MSNIIQNNYINPRPFRFWCQKVLPLVYDDSLSYYELLCKVVDYINNLINDNNTMIDNIDALYNAFNQLQDYVNNYFDTVDFDSMVSKIEELPTSPTVDGDYILRRTSGVNSYATAPGMKVVTVSGSTVTQTGVANTFYVCGTVATLSFTAPSSGICGIRFTSASTATVLTVSGVSYWMNGFDPTSLESNKTYEISILNGVGVVGC